MVHVKEAVVVEGRYDAIKLSSVTDALIVECGGFGIRKNREKLDFIRKLAVERGVIILTDSDDAGFRIRSFLSDRIKEGAVYHAYAPALVGKERRKTAAGKEGLLGVEGIDAEALEKAIRDALPRETASPAPSAFTKADLYELGYFGRPDSAKKRRELCERLSLPPRLSANALVKYLSTAGIKKEDIK